MNTFEKIYILLTNARDFHAITTKKLNVAESLYNSAPYSSEAIFELIVAEQNNKFTENLLKLVQHLAQTTGSLSNVLRTFVLNQLRSILVIDADQSPDPLITLTDSELIEVFAILLKYHIQPSHLGRLVELSTTGELKDISIWVTEVTKRVRKAIRDGLGDPDFDDPPSLDLNTLWTSPPNYPYDREGAAQYVIDKSRENFENNNNGVFTYPVGTAEDFTLPLGVGSSFQYSFLSHTEGSTGSALFISESLYFGGNLKMRTDDTIPVNCDTNDLSDSNPIWNTLWFICKPAGATNLETTVTWRDHRFLMPYFHETMQVPILTTTGNSIEQRKEDTIFFIHPDDINLSSPSSQPPSAFTQDSLSRYMDFANGGVWESGFETDGQNYLYNRFEDKGLSDLQTGDYMYFNLGSNTSGHGLLIVGWGDAINSPEGLNIYEGTHNFYKQRRPDTIPYVADFAYGIPVNSDGIPKDTDQVGWLQDIRPRPFYSCLAGISSTQLASQLQNLKNTSNGFDPQTIVEYEERLRDGIWGIFAFIGGGLPQFQFFRFPDHVVIKDSQVVVEP